MCVADVAAKRAARASLLVLLLVYPVAAKVPPGYVDASMFGYDPIDATSALQAAINTGSNVYVPKMNSDWTVSPIALTHSNQVILFEPGTVVAAKAGSYLGINDSLFTASEVSSVTMIGYGATFVMRKNDYRQPPYQAGEWRHGVKLLDVTGFEIRGLTIKDTGGDGIYVGTNTGTGFSKNVSIKDVFLDNNYRQGISVISVDTLIIDNAIIKNTNGTSPQSGIDFEMNLSTQRIQNAVVRNSIFQANTYGILLAYPDDLDVDIGPYSVDIEHVTIIGNNSDGIIMGRPSPNMTIRDSLIIDNGDYGVRGAIGSFSVDRNVMGHTAFWGNGKGARTGWTQLGVGTLTNVQPVLRTTNPSSPYFLYLDSSNPDSILHGSRNGTFLGARPVYPIPEPDTTSTMSTACCMLALPMPSRGCKEQRGGAIDGCLVLHTIHHKFTRSHE